MKQQKQHMTPEEISNLELWRLIRMVARLLFRVRMGELEPCGISVRQAAMLSGIKALGPEATPANIARRQYRDPSTVSNILIRMEKMGLVHRGEDPGNQRKVLVSLTPKGEELYRQSMAYGLLKQVLAPLTDDERSCLTATLKKLRKSARDVIHIHDLERHGNTEWDG